MISPASACPSLRSLLLICCPFTLTHTLFVFFRSFFLSARITYCSTVMQRFYPSSNDGLHLHLVTPSTITMTSSSSLSMDLDESTETRIQRLILEHPVIIFTRSSFCCMCHVMKNLLATIGVIPTVIQLDDHEIAALQPTSDVTHPPAAFIGGTCIGGLDSLVALHLSGHLVPKLLQVGALCL